MVQTQRTKGWIQWPLLMGIGLGCWGALPTESMGWQAIAPSTSIAQAAESAQLTAWSFHPDRQQLELLLPAGTTPHYFLLAQPARIVLDVAAQVGTASGEQTYGGAVRRVRVAQFEPGLTRIVLELNPDAVLAPGQVELTAVETTTSGETRWMVRPLLVGMDSEGVGSDGSGAIAPPPPEPVAATPVDVAPAPAPTPIATPAVEPTVGAVPPVEATPPPELSSGMDDQATVADRPPALESTPAPEPVDTTTPSSPIAIPTLEPAPLPPASPVAEPTTNSPVTTTVPSLSDEDPLLYSGVEALMPEPAALPPVQEGAIATNPNGDDALTTTTFPDAIEIPVDFPTPTELSNPAANTPAPQAIMVPPLDGIGPAPVAVAPQTMTVPPPDEMGPAPVAPQTMTEPLPDETTPTPVAAVPMPPDLLLPAGTRVQLRYPRTSTLTLTEQPWQEVLVLVNPVQDAQGNVLIPAGSQIIGRFERDGRGHRFVAQAIALDTTVVQLQGRSQTLTDRGITPNTLIDLDITQDVRRSPTP